MIAETNSESKLSSITLQQALFMINEMYFTVHQVFILGLRIIYEGNEPRNQEQIQYMCLVLAC